MSKLTNRDHAAPYHTDQFLPQHPTIYGELPAVGFVREAVLIGRPARQPTPRRPKGQPAIHGVLGFSAATLWRMVRSKRFPTPVKLGPNTTAWRVEDVRSWMQAQKIGGDV
jgi:predicted DNA-binding transcriptional regulator AlpA